MTQRPDSVQEASLMLYASAGIHAIYLCSSISVLMQSVMEGSNITLCLILFCALSIGIWGILGFFTSRKRDWARKAALYFLGASTLIYIATLPSIFSDNFGFFINCIVCLLLQFSACILLCLRKSKEWFAEKV